MSLLRPFAAGMGVLIAQTRFLRPSSANHSRPVLRRPGVCFLAGLVIGCTLVTAQPAGHPGQIADTCNTWLFFDGPLWDISDDGLPFLVTLGFPTRLDPISRLLHGSENRWTLHLGYARAYDSYDPNTGIFKNPGGHALMLGAARQILWNPPRALQPWAPRLSLGLGFNYATTPFKADGTCVNFIVLPGLEWQWPGRDPHHRWLAGIRWLHLSNGNLLNRNAGYDGLTFQVGRTLSF